MPAIMRLKRLLLHALPVSLVMVIALINIFREPENFLWELRVDSGF